MRIAIAGCGRLAERGYVPAALAMPGMEIVGFADPDLERLDLCRHLWEQGGGGQARAFASAAELLQNGSIDLLVVAAPAAHHLALAEAAAAAGVPSLVEKPPTSDLEGARRLAQLDPQPLLALNRRFLQGAELRPAIPAEGWLELDLEMRFRRGGWGAYESNDEALLDAGIHLIDLACFLTGSAPIAVRGAQVEQERAGLELELTRGRARISCATDRRHREAVAIRNRSGALLARSFTGGARGRLGALTGKPDPLVLSLQRQLQALTPHVPEPHQIFHPADGESDAVRGRRGAISIATASDGVAAMAVVEAARRSAGLGGAEVTVAPVAEAAA